LAKQRQVEKLLSQFSALLDPFFQHAFISGAITDCVRARGAHYDALCTFFVGVPSFVDGKQQTRRVNESLISMLQTRMMLYRNEVKQVAQVVPQRSPPPQLFVQQRVSDFFIPPEVSSKSSDLSLRDEEERVTQLHSAVNAADSTTQLSPEALSYLQSLGLSDIAIQKLKSPTLQLNLPAQINFIDSCIQAGGKASSEGAKKHNVVLIGNTGAGELLPNHSRLFSVI
jgi:hypothetical protein